MANNVKASVYLKRLFRKAKQVKGQENLTLNAFARKLVKDGDPQAAAWFAHKSPRFNDEARALRKKNKGAKIAAEANATKLARRKKAERSRSKVAAADTAKVVETKKV